MKAIRTVNLIWERKARGGYPASPYALADDGTLLRALPRPLESRAYDIARVAPNETVQTGGFFSAETLIKLDIAGDADAALGMTADDIYLFRNGGKTRFLGERQYNYLDAALDAGGQTLAVSFCDVAGTHFGLACGNTSGRVAWLRESESAVPAVSVSRDGSFIVYGAEDGAIVCVSAGMSDIWNFEQAEPIRAVAISEDGNFAAYGTADGAVGLIDGNGARRWETRFPGEIAALALSGDGGLCAVIVHPKDGGAGAKLACVTENGTVGWEYNTEKRLLRVSVSPNGRYVAAGSRDGTTTVYEIVPSELTGGVITATLQNEAERRAAGLERTGDLMGAFHVLREAMSADPANAALSERAYTLRGQWRANQHAEIKRLFEAEDWLAAIDMAEKALQEDPRNPATLMLLNGAVLEQGKCLPRASAAKRTYCGGSAALPGADLHAVSNRSAARNCGPPRPPRRRRRRGSGKNLPQTANWKRRSPRGNGRSPSCRPQNASEKSQRRRRRRNTRRGLPSTTKSATSRRFSSSAKSSPATRTTATRNAT